MRVDAVLVSAIALLFGATVSAAPVPAILAAGFVGILLAPSLGIRGVLVAVALFVTGAVRAGGSIEEFETRRIEARDALGAPTRCAARAVIAESPTWARDAASYVATLSHIDCEGRALALPLRVRLYGGPDDLRRGDVLDVVVQIAPIGLFRNHGLPDPTPRAARRGVVSTGMALSVVVVARGSGIRAWIDQMRAHARRRIRATFSVAAAPMARALVLGENDLDAEDDAAFRKSGLSHMLAVSGTHLVFAVVSLVFGLVFVLVRIERLSASTDVSRMACAVGAALALFYADFAGGSGSAWRAAWMLAAAFIARAFGRRPAAARVLAASLFVGAIEDSLMVFDISFLLSAAATAGLITLGRPLARACESLQVRPLRYVALSTAATLSSMLPCAPLLALMAPDLTIAGVLANLVASPFGELIALPLCLAHGLLAFFPALERGVALVASGALLLVKQIAHLSAAASFLAFPVPAPGAWHLAILAASVAAVTYATRLRHVAALAGFVLLALGIVELAARRVGQPRGELRVTALDVGQGDATLVDLPDGSSLLIDAGGFVGSPIDPGRSVILPLLRERRRRRVDVAILTHPHPDHFTGFASVLNEIAVGEFWDTGQGESEGAGPVYEELMQSLRTRGVAVKRPAELCERPREFGGASLRVLGPCPAFEPGANANDNSLVLRISYGAQSVLFTGDAEEHQEQRLLARHGAALRADLLKVGHHGSRTSSTSEFLQAVRPSIATISCGVRNRFGHPHAVTLARLSEQGVLALRLDRVGSVMWRTTGSEPEVGIFALPR